MDLRGQMKSLYILYILYIIYIYLHQGAGKRPAAQEKKIVRASPEGPRAAEEASSPGQTS